jgi:hypothetical protein
MAQTEDFELPILADLREGESKAAKSRNYPKTALSTQFLFLI